MSRTLHHHWGLLILLVIFTALSAYQSAVLPLGEADDETDHYQYLRFVARTGYPPLTEADRIEAGFKGGLAPLYYWLAAWPVALVGADTPPDVRRVDSRPQRHIPTDGLGINHVLHTLDETWPWQGQPLAWHLVRLLSIPMSWVTIIATYALARRLVEPLPIALGAATFVAFLPRFVFGSAAITDDNLVFAIIALLLLVQVALLQRRGPPPAPQMALFGTLFGLALVTKYFSLILLPEILLTLIVVVRSGGSVSKKFPFRQIATFLIALLLSAGLWFIFIALRFNRVAELGWVAGLAASLGEPQITEGLVGLLSGQPVRPPATTFSLVEWFGLLYRSFWFEYGWMQIFAPTWVYGLFTLFAFMAVAGLVSKRFGRIPAPIRTPRPDSGSELPATAARVFSPQSTEPRAIIIILLGLHLLLFCIVVLVRYILSATIDTGQGRHLYPALPSIALLVGSGIYYLACRVRYLVKSDRPTFIFWLLFLPFLLPALASLWPETDGTGFTSRFISSEYHTHPVTRNPRLPLTGPPLDLQFAPGLFLTGVAAPSTASAGESLPVTLLWHAAQNGALPVQDFLVSLCLQNAGGQPVSCWRGHFEDGRYPARAWEAGDTLIDTVYLPLPACDRPTPQPLRLHLTVWPLLVDQPLPVAGAVPALLYQFEQPQITITPTNHDPHPSQSVELWATGQRLSAPLTVIQRQALTYISHGVSAPSMPPRLVHSGGEELWLPAADWTANLHYLCEESGETADVLTTRLDYFIADPTLPSGEYQAGAGLPVVTLDQRQRRLVPITTSLTFSDTLAPLVLTSGGQSTSLVPEHVAAPTLRIEHPVPQPLPVTIRWQARRWMSEPLVIALKLLDKDFTVAGQRLATVGDRYPNLLWVPTEAVEEEYIVSLLPEASAGLYRLEMSLIRQDRTLTQGYENLPVVESGLEVGNNLYPVVVRLLDPAHGSEPPQPFSAQLGETIRLVGYSLAEEQGRILPNNNLTSPTFNLVLYWQSTGSIPVDYTVFTQLVAPNGEVWAQWDNPPQAGRYPTSAWLENDDVIDRYSLTLRDGAPAGEYQLLVGMYNPTTGERIPVIVAGQTRADRAVPLAIVTLTRN
jgi:hypothetical protein